MLNLTLRVVRPGGDEKTYAIIPKVVVAFERQFGVGIGRAFQEQQKAEHLYWLAWKAEQASGAVVKPFDDWLDNVNDVELIEDDAAPLTGGA